jgi:hypothetical protein
VYQQLLDTIDEVMKLYIALERLRTGTINDNNAAQL